MTELPMRDDPAGNDAERVSVLIAYGLMLLGVVNGITALIAVVIAYVRLGETRGTLWESHYRNIVTVFWIGVVLILVLMGMALSGVLAMLGLAFGAPFPDWGALLALPLLGLWVPLALLGWLGFWVWFLYRCLRGLLRALDGKAC